jgi:4-hydroxy 2-oxovalerate aldolase
MGRGAGNTRTEQLLAALAQDGGEQFNAEPLISLVDEDFRALQKRYGWGPTMPYLFTGSHRIHPTYAQELLSKGLDDTSAIDILAELKDLSGKTSFDARVLDGAVAAISDHRARFGLRQAQ